MGLKQFELRFLKFVSAELWLNGGSMASETLALKFGLSEF